MKTLNKREIAALLSGLRHVQAQRKKASHMLNALAVAHAIETDDGAFKRLSLAAIDELCESLNGNLVLVISAKDAERLQELLDEFIADQEHFLQIDAMSDAQEESRTRRQICLANRWLGLLHQAAKDFEHPPHDDDARRHSVLPNPARCFFARRRRTSPVCFS